MKSGFTKKDPRRWITRSFESLYLTQVDFRKLEIGRKEGKIIFPNPETRIVDSRGIDLDRRIRKDLDLDLRQWGMRVQTSGKRRRASPQSSQRVKSRSDRKLGPQVIARGHAGGS
jgi:hypothetical protein